MSDAHQITDPAFCQHTRKDVRRRVDAGGCPFYQYQCLDYGSRGGAMIAAAVALAGGRTLLPFDSPLEARGEQEFERLYQTRLSEHQLEVARRQTARQQKYEAYPQTDVWRAKSARVLARDRGVCQGCFELSATQVHHLTYERLGDEPLFDLISVCDECHERIYADKATAQ